MVNLKILESCIRMCLVTKFFQVPQNTVTWVNYEGMEPPVKKNAARLRARQPRPGPSPAELPGRPQAASKSVSDPSWIRSKSPSPSRLDVGSESASELESRLRPQAARPLAACQCRGNGATESP